jgi:hypothetical protein
MFARIAEVYGPPERLAAAGGRLQERLIPALRQADGFRGCVCVPRAATDDTLVVTLWAGEAEMLASDGDAGCAIAEAAAAFGLATDELARHEIVT